MRKFIILTTMRSGSTLLWRYLDGHPNIAAHGEMFLNSLKRGDSYATFRKTSLKTRVLHHTSRKKMVDQYLTRLFQVDEGIKAAGFKLMYPQIFNELEEWINLNEVHVIHLIRKNVLKIILSRETARIRKLTHTTTTENIVPVKVRIKPARLVKTMGRILDEVEFHRKRFSKKPRIEVAYEAFMTDKEAVTRRISEFLDVPYFDNMPMPPLKKINPDSIRELMSNYEEVRQSLTGTPFEIYLK